MKPLIDPAHPFFARPWVRWATVLLPLAWAGVELYMGALVWAALFGALGAYAGWVLLVRT